MQQQKRSSPSSPSSSPIDLFLFAYGSAAFVILFLATAGYLIVRLTSDQEVRYRAAASLINLQELHTQALTRDSILLITAGDQSAELAQIQHVLPLWEATQGMLLHGGSPDLSSTLLAAVVKEQADYLVMDHSLHDLLALENAPGYPWARVPTIAATSLLSPTQMAHYHLIGKDVGVIFFKQISVLPPLYMLYNTLSAQADAKNVQEGWLDLGVLLATFLTLLLEAFGVILPANRRLRAAFARIHTLEEEAVVATSLPTPSRPPAALSSSSTPSPSLS